MIPHTWIQMQVFSMAICEIKQTLDRKRLRIDRNRLVDYLVALMEQQAQMRHFKAVHRNNTCGVGYAGFMAGLELVAPLWVKLEAKFRKDRDVEFGDLTLADSSLLPSKEETSITDQDWKNKRVTTRSVSDGSGHTRKLRVCGEKLLAVMNGRGQLVYCKLLPTINSADDNVFKNPMSWATKGLRRGDLLVDRGFSNNEVRKGLAFLGQTLPGYSLRLVSPPRKSQKWVLTDEDKTLYKKRWDIEESFRQLKDALGRFRLSMKGSRKPCIREARVAIATLAWNMENI